MSSPDAVRAMFGAVQAAGRQTRERVFTVILALRARHLFLIDLAIITVSIEMALGIRHGGPMTFDFVASFLPAAILPLIVRPVVGARFGLYRRLWALASVQELSQILYAVAIGSVICVALAAIAAEMQGPTAARLPVSFWILELIVSLALVGGVRFVIRAVADLGRRARVDGATVSLVPALLFGAGGAGAMMARSANREPAAGVKPVGFLDDDRAKRGATVVGLPVFGGLRELELAVRRTGARMLLITLPNPSGDTIRRIMSQAETLGLQVRTVPPVRGLFDGTWDARRVRDIRLEDLLTREQVTVHAPEVAETIRDQVVMVTGAGGSIGSELARQVHSFGPSRLVLVDRAESPLYMIQRELELRALNGHGGGELSIHLANVASRGIMTRLIEETRPAVIFHAAACKHVPMIEEHPSEGVQVNVGGTMAVLAAAVHAGVQRFVLVSTDKAVEPSSVMGATKRLAEWLVADAAERTGRSYVAVRFGNVLGSAGSVVPIFQGQLENGEPITITHPEMTRYFMTIQEASLLILDAGAIGGPGDLFVLDMGEPVRIVDIARDLIRLSGRSESSVSIQFTGLRPGEKLHERLFYEAEKVVRTDVDKILRVADPARPADVVDRAQRLLELALGDRDAELRSALFRMVSIQSVVDGADQVWASVGPAERSGEGHEGDPGRQGYSTSVSGRDPANSVTLSAS